MLQPCMEFRGICYEALESFSVCDMLFWVLFAVPLCYLPSDLEGLNSAFPLGFTWYNV